MPSAIQVATPVPISPNSSRLVEARYVQPVQPLRGERVLVGEQVEYGEQESEVADPGDYERLLGGVRGGSAPVPEAYEQV